MYIKKWKLSKDRFIQRKSSYLILLPLKLYGRKTSSLKKKKKKIFPQEAKVSLQKINSKMRHKMVNKNQKEGTHRDRWTGR